ncbi:MAG TPA: DUF3108 domain-containing protein [Methyloceanibacter sp.]|jgi:hypothetical protein
MQAAGHCLRLAAVGALTCGLGGSPANAENTITTANQVVAVYRVDLAGFNLGNFTVTARFKGDDYEMRGVGNFSILQGIIYEWKGTTLAKGKMTNGGPEPAMYALSYQGGGKGEQLRMNFTDGGVSDVAIVPRKRASPRTIPVTKEQLEGVFDPMSGAFLYAHSDNPNGDVKVCEQTVPAFDGRQRFDIVLTPKRVVQVKRDAKSGGYAGPAVICQVRFIPIAGYQPDNPGIQLMSQTDEIEVWLVPLKGTAMYVPYRIVLPTPVGYGSALATSFHVRGAQRASNDPAPQP